MLSDTASKTGRSLGAMYESISDLLVKHVKTGAVRAAADKGNFNGFDPT